MRNPTNRTRLRVTIEYHTPGRNVEDSFFFEGELSHEAFDSIMGILKHFFNRVNPFQKKVKDEQELPKNTHPISVVLPSKEEATFVAAQAEDILNG